MEYKRHYLNFLNVGTESVLCETNVDIKSVGLGPKSGKHENGDQKVVSTYKTQHKFSHS